MDSLLFTLERSGRPDSADSRQGLECKSQITHGLKTRLRIILKTAGDDATEPRVSRVSSGELRLEVQDSAEFVRGGPADEGRTSREHFVEHRAHRENVTSLFRVAAADLLG